jgi:hypothetical protein
MYAKGKVVSYMAICLGKASRLVITIIYMPNPHKYIGKIFIKTNSIILKMKNLTQRLEKKYFKNGN